MNMKYAVIINGDDEYTVEPYNTYEDAQNAMWLRWNQLTNGERRTLYTNGGCNTLGAPYMVALGYYDAVNRTVGDYRTLADLLEIL